MALTLAKLLLLEVDLITVALGMPKNTSNKEKKEAKGVVAPLVDVAAGIIDDRLLLVDEYPEGDDAPVGSPMSPRPAQRFGY